MCAPFGISASNVSNVSIQGIATSIVFDYIKVKELWRDDNNILCFICCVASRRACFVIILIRET